MSLNTYERREYETCILVSAVMVVEHDGEGRGTCFGN